MPSFTLNDSKHFIDDIDHVTPEILSLFFAIEDPSTIVLLSDRGALHKSIGDAFVPKLKEDAGTYTIKVGKVQTSIATVPSQSSSRTTVAADQPVKTRIIAECTENQRILMTSVENLAMAPLACFVADEVGLLAAGIKDVSLENQATTKIVKFEFLNRPQSLKASLYQMQTSMCTAFGGASRAMKIIRIEMGHIPSLMETVMELLVQTRSSSDEKILKNSVGDIKSCANKCETAANTAYNGFTSTINVVKELTEAALTTQGAKENEAAEKEKERERCKVMVEAMKRTTEEAEEDIRKLQNVVQNFREEYTEALKDSKSLWRLASAKLGDTAGNIVNDVLPMRLLKLDHHVAKAVTNVASSFISSPMAQTLRSKLEMPQSLKDALSFLNDPPASDEKLDEIMKALKTGIDANSESNTSKLSREALTFLENLKKTPRTEWSKELMARKAKEITDSSMNDTKQANASSVSQAQTSLLQAQIDAAKTAKSAYESERDLLERTRLQQRKDCRELAELSAQMRTIDLTKTDIKEIIGFLKEGLKKLGAVQQIFENIRTFFSDLQAVISNDLNTQLQRFATNTSSIESGTAVDGRTERMFQEIVLRACCVSRQVGQAAVIYVKISDAHIMPIISGCGKNLGLDPAEATRKLHQRQIESEAIKQEVEQTIRESVDDAFRDTKNMLESLTL